MNQFFLQEHMTQILRNMNNKNPLFHSFEKYNPKTLIYVISYSETYSLKLFKIQGLR